MSDIMRPISFKELLKRMVLEYKQSKSIFGIPVQHFFVPDRPTEFSVFNERCGLPLGPAAGPHTQLAQNIVVSYLVGARFIELKTVQILDTLEIEKPCIDALDEGFNTEWSSEFTLQKAYDEYLKGYFLLHFLEKLFSLGSNLPRSFIFNMSVGYDLAGIQSPQVDAFIENLIDASKSELFDRYKKELSEVLCDTELFKDSDLENPVKTMKGIEQNISPQVCSQITLSTMHGCPPEEIEKICGYMLTEKKLDCFVKLNPTLLGYDFVHRTIVDSGYHYITLSKESFEHDLQYRDAVPMLKRLKVLAKEHNKNFGVKLTNTLGLVNSINRLPGEEMYMSGRLLFPLSINVASKLAREFDGKLDISFSGGIFKFNLQEVLETGIGPVTVATDLLKPGGYFRMKQMAELIESMDMPSKAISSENSIDLKALERLAKKSLGAEYEYREKRWHGLKKVSVDGNLPLTDCYVAPCVSACPIEQDVPEYIKLVDQSRFKEALTLIYERNPLPSITGHICAHQCEYNCTRIDYEDAVEIREVKRIALEKGFDQYRAEWKKPETNRNNRVAIIGAGPAGLSAAYFLIREGFAVTVFDEHDGPGGVVEYNIPDFRIPREAIEHDVNFIKEHGVEFTYNYKFDFDIDQLRNQGFGILLLAIGADKVQKISVEGSNGSIMPSHDFIGQFNRDRSKLNLGKDVVIVGAGDTAMDSARTALRIDGVEKVTLVYRRSEAQIPATEEEYEEAREEDIEFKWLRNPERFDSEGLLHLRVMELGDADASGRKRPLPTDRTETIHCDTLIPSIGETVDYEEIGAGGIALNSDGRLDTDDFLQLQEDVYLIGDVRTGPTTIVSCIAEARKAVDGILKKEGGSKLKQRENLSIPLEIAKIHGRKGQLSRPINRKKPYGSGDFARLEAHRCLECNIVCNKCVDVCPNRANLAIPVDGMKNSSQIVHFDAFCNECGNCASFCPWNGKPFLDKITVFSRKEDFENSRNPGFYLDGTQLSIRQENSIFNGSVDSHGTIILEKSDQMSHTLSHESKKIFSALYNDHSYVFGPVED